MQMKVEDQPLSLEDVQLRKLAKVTRRLLLNASRHYEQSQESTLLWPVLAHTAAALCLSSAVWVISRAARLCGLRAIKGPLSWFPK
jgi:hypothetical protein